MKGPVPAAGRVLLLWLALAVPVWGSDILLVADEWCPYNCAPDGDAPGYVVEIARYAFEPEGHRVVYRMIPWARAIDGTRNGLFHGIIGAGRDEVPDFIFTDREIGVASHTFYVVRESTWRYEGVSSLSRIRLGVIKDYSYGTLFQEYIQPNSHNPKRVFTIAGDDPLTRSIRMLQLARVDAIVEDSNVVEYFYQTRGEKNPLKSAGIASREKIYIAFSPVNRNSAGYASLLDQAIHRLRQSGRLQELLAKYGIQAW